MAYDPDIKAYAKKLYLTKGWTFEQVGLKLKVSAATIGRWAKDGAWVKERPGGSEAIAANVVKLTHRRTRAFAKDQAANQLDVLKDEHVCNLMLVDLMEALGDCRSIQEYRAIGSISAAVIKLLEFRRKVAPPTAAALAEQAIALGISPAEFVAALREQWRQEA